MDRKKVFYHVIHGYNNIGKLWLLIRDDLPLMNTWETFIRLFGKGFNDSNLIENDELLRVGEYGKRHILSKLFNESSMNDRIDIF